MARSRPYLNRRSGPRSLWSRLGRNRAQEPALEGVVIDAAAARKRARDEVYRATPDAIMLRMLNGG